MRIQYGPATVTGEKRCRRRSSAGWWRKAIEKGQVKPMVRRVDYTHRCGIVLALVVSFGFLIAGCAGSQESASPVAGSFVGETSDPNTLVAVSTDEPGQGEEAREVRAYVCDSKNINEWFKGSVTGDELELSSNNGAQLTGEIASEAASGNITMSDGTSLSFEIPPAAGIGGLYNVTSPSDGSLSGTSERGAKLTGRLSTEEAQNGLYPVSGTISSPDGQQQDFQTEVYVLPEAPETVRWVVLSDGRIAGPPISSAIFQ